MIELRCQHKKLGELNPETVRIAIRCRHCSQRHRRDVYHEFALARLLDVLANGQTTGSIPSEDAAEDWVA